jgi:AcrR family transcriptional regulator
MHLTQGALFRHFANKDAIMQAVMEWVAAQLLARIDRAADGVTSPLAALRSMFMAHVAFVAEHPGAPRIIFSELQRAGEMLTKRMVQTLIASYGMRLKRLIEQGQAQGELHSGLNVQAATTMFIGTIQGLVMQSLITGDMQRMRRDAVRVFAIYQRGIAAGNESTG